MFDNNMNNNDNFNNGTPLFGNNQNNIGINNEYPNGMNGFNNNQNGSFVQPWQQNNNIQNFSVQSYDTYNNGMTSNNYNSSISISNDIPPDLGEIKNLSDASVASAPTMDVLAPMNVMPESLPPKQDPLDAYENGSLNIQNNVPNINMNLNNSFPQQNYNVQNTIPNYPNNQPDLNNFNSNVNLMNNNYPTMNISNTDTNNNVQNQPSFSVPSSNFPTVEGVQNLYQTNSIPSFNNLDYNQIGSQPQNDFNTNSALNNSLPSLNDNYNLPSNEAISNENSYPTPTENMNYITKEENSNNSDDTEDDSTTTSSSVLIPEESKEESEDNEKNEESNTISNNEEPQEVETKGEESTETNLEDLGIEADFSEPDTLEIMDIDNDFEQVSNEVNESLEENKLENQETKGLVSKNVDKIKALIEELKESGADIELEEFDFESMYQLIVKLKK